MTEDRDPGFDKWREAQDERRAAEERERERAQRRAQREAAAAAQDRRIETAIAAEHELMIELLGEMFGMERADTRELIAKMIDQELRNPHWRPKFCGTWREGEAYDRMSIVGRDGSTWICKRDSPAGIPGASDDWALLGLRGERGRPGERGAIGPAGPPGPRGESGRELSGWRVDARRFELYPLLDGKHGPPINLKPFFEQFLRELGQPPMPQLPTEPAHDISKATERFRRGAAPSMVAAVVNGAPPESIT